MGVNQIVFFNSEIFFNIFLAFFVLSIALFVTFFLVKNNFARLVIFFGYVCYLFPIFVIKDWQIDYFDYLKYFEIVVIFFICVIFFYHFLNIFYVKKKNTVYSNINFENSLIKNQKIFEKLIFRIFYFLTIFFLVYFIVFDYSPILSWYKGTESGIARYKIYESPIYIQLLYIIFCRLISVIVILLVPKKKILFYFILIELIAIQSLERQSVFIIMAAVFARYIFQKSKINFFVFLISIIFVMMISYIQGNFIFNIGSNFEIFKNFLILSVNRIILDPAQTLHLVYLKSQGINFYLMNNTIFQLLFSNIFVENTEISRGYTAIGIITDGYKIFSNNFGVIIASLWFSILIKFSQSIIQKIYNKNSKLMISAILFFSLVSFYYSNIFSIVPHLIIFIIYLIQKKYRL